MPRGDAHCRYLCQQRLLLRIRGCPVQPRLCWRSAPPCRRSPRHGRQPNRWRARATTAASPRAWRGTACALVRCTRPALLQLPAARPPRHASRAPRGTGPGCHPPPVRPAMEGMAAQEGVGGAGSGCWAGARMAQQQARRPLDAAGLRADCCWGWHTRHPDHELHPAEWTVDMWCHGQRCLLAPVVPATPDFGHCIRRCPPSETQGVVCQHTLILLVICHERGLAYPCRSLLTESMHPDFQEHWCLMVVRHGCTTSFITHGNHTQHRRPDLFKGITYNSTLCR